MPKNVPHRSQSLFVPVKFDLEREITVARAMMNQILDDRLAINRHLTHIDTNMGALRLIFQRIQENGRLQDVQRTDHVDGDGGGRPDPDGRPDDEERRPGSLRNDSGDQSGERQDDRASGGGVKPDSGVRGPSVDLPAAARHLTVAGDVKILGGEYEGRIGVLTEIKQTGFGHCHGVVRIRDGGESVQIRTEQITHDV